jgi:hypothetical protein
MLKADSKYLVGASRRDFSSRFWRLLRAQSVTWPTLHTGGQCSSGCRTHWHSSFVMSLHETFAVLITKIRTPSDPFTATARAQRRFQPMSSQEVWRLVTEQVFGGNLLPAATLAVH